MAAGHCNALMLAMLLEKTLFVAVNAVFPSVVQPADHPPPLFCAALPVNVLASIVCVATFVCKRITVLSARCVAEAGQATCARSFVQQRTAAMPPPLVPALFPSMVTLYRLKSWAVNA